MNSNLHINSGMDLNTFISLLPKDNIQTKYHFRWRLGFIPQWKKKIIKVIYSIQDEILQVSFEKPNGVRFINQYSAEKYFYGPIEISTHVGKHVVTSVHDVHHHILCKRCGVKYFKDAYEFIGTDDMFSGNDRVAIEFTDTCPKCGGIRTIDIHERCS